MVKSAEERIRRGQEGRHKNSLFCADDRMIASSDPRWLQGDFINFLGLFYRVCLKTNIGSKVRMFFRP